MSVLIVIPTLNEEHHIAATLRAVLPFAADHDARIVVADGGSTDATRRIVTELAETHPQITLLDNPRRLQSAAVNLAVEQFGDEAEYLIRIDAHSGYPADYCATLLAEAEAMQADSVTVSMVAVGETPLQRLIAAAQNSRLGNGGASHRNRGEGAWVDHGHHALMRITPFRQIGGYDESFSHNEDAELDHRLRMAGFSIWLTARTAIEYYPRATLGALFRQYFLFGKGRARNLAKHRMRPALRQMAVAALAPLLALAILWPLSGVFAVPLVVWTLACLAGGAVIALHLRDLRGLASGFLAGLMHLAWSAGFWAQTIVQKMQRG